MARLPADLSGQDLRKALVRVGFVLTRQRGSHMICDVKTRGRESLYPITNPIRPGTLHQILKAAGLSIDDLLSLL